MKILPPKSVTARMVDLDKPLVVRTWEEMAALRVQLRAVAAKLKLRRRLAQEDGIKLGPFRDATRIASMSSGAAQDYVTELVRNLKDLGVVAKDSPEPVFVQGRLL